MSPTAEQARTIDVLREARELISDPERWTRQAPARDADGCSVPPRDGRAVCWCAVGAALRMGRELGVRNAAVWALEDATTASAVSVNDNGGHKRVMALYARAIARLEKAA